MNHPTNNIEGSEVINRRESSIEALRMLAILMIIARHYVSFADTDIEYYRLSINKIFLEALVYPGGKVGVVLFFVISAWYLGDSSPSIRGSAHRAWRVELEILFWSLALLLMYLLIDPGSLSASTVVRSFAPTVTDLWWYATAYILFLLLLPFLLVGLRALDQRWHLYLSIIVFVAVTLIAGILPGAHGMVDQSVILFVYLFILTTYVRWYQGLPSPKVGWILTISGIAVSVTWVLFWNIVSERWNRARSLELLLGGEAWRLPCVLIGFGLFIVAANVHFRSALVNWTARSTFAAYLITGYPPVATLLWEKLFRMEAGIGSHFLPLLLAGLTLGIFAACVAIDSIRRLIFVVVVDRFEMRIFSVLWSATSSFGTSMMARIDSNAALRS